LNPRPPGYEPDELPTAPPRDALRRGTLASADFDYTACRPPCQSRLLRQPLYQPRCLCVAVTVGWRSCIIACGAGAVNSHVAGFAAEFANRSQCVVNKGAASSRADAAHQGLDAMVFAEAGLQMRGPLSSAQRRSQVRHPQGSAPLAERRSPAGAVGFVRH
jgi:hypothetical protein